MLFHPKKVSETKLIARDIAAITFWFGLLILIPMVVGVIYQEPSWPLYLPMVLLVSGGSKLVLLKFKKDEKPFTHMTIVSLGATWLVISVLGAMPFFVTAGFGPIDSYFESVSAVSTCGITTIQHPESFPQSVLFWRAMLAWFGGIGITAFAFYSIMQSESMSRIVLGEGYDRLKPSLVNSAREIFKIYAFWTVLGIIFLCAIGLPLFDSFNLSMNAISTTGMDVHTGGWNYYHDNLPQAFPLMAIFLAFLSIMGAVSFVVHYRVLHLRKLKAYLQDGETALYLAIIIVGLVAVSGYMLAKNDFSTGMSYEVVSASTGGYELSPKITGEASTFVMGILTILSLIGGCSNSAAGGLKVRRVYVLLKYLYWTIKQELSPEGAVSHFKHEGKHVHTEEISDAAMYAVVYFCAIIVVTMIMISFDRDAAGSILTVTSAQAGGGLSPMNGWDLYPVEKMALTGTMLFGRLEFMPLFALVLYLVRRK